MATARTARDQAHRPASRPRRTAQPQAKPRRGGRVTDARRREIVEHAARLFLERGYDAVSIDDIVAATGGSKRTLYERFGGKAGLFESVIRDCCADVDRDLEAGIDPQAPIAAQLERIGQNFLSMVLDPRILELHRLMVSMGRSFPEVARLFYAAGPRSARTIVADWMRRQMQAGRLPASDPELLATLYLNMLMGEHQMARLLSVPDAASRAQADATVAAATRLLLAGLNASGARP